MLQFLNTGKPLVFFLSLDLLFMLNNLHSFLLALNDLLLLQFPLEFNLLLPLDLIPLHFDLHLLPVLILLLFLLPPLPLDLLLLNLQQLEPLFGFSLLCQELLPLLLEDKVILFLNLFDLLLLLPRLLSIHLL